MTCIVGLEHDGKVTIGGDSAGVGGYSLTIRADEKVFKVGEFAMGFTSSFRMGQLLRYKLSLPSFPENVDLDRYMATSFIDAVRQVMKDGGYCYTNNGRESGGTFLVGIRGRLYTIAGDFQIGRSTAGYNAVGCGDDLAIGALFATEGARITPKDRITKALQAAERFSAGVAPPFNFVDV